MKKLVALFLGSLLVISYVAAGDSSADANQKWLAAVEKMVKSGDTRVSTPDEDRVKLLKKWAAQKGYTAEVAKTEMGFKIELTKVVVQK
jgi:hypothetical protein